MKKLYCSLSVACVFLLLITVPAFAQRSVSGTVQDDTGQPLPGVSILEKGTTNGATSDTDGKYSLNVGSNDATLVFSFIGYKSVEQPVSGRTLLNVNLDPDVTALQEVVITGYTTENRREVTGAVSTVKTEQLRAVPSGNVEQQLQGRVSGVTVITNGQPGTTSVVRLRGFGSIGGNEPLYIVDGLPVGSVDFLSPDDIETTTVLKDAASASLYGARAAGGVIVYTTKKGKKDGSLKITYDGIFGITNPGKVDEILNPQEQADWTWNAIRNTALQDPDPTKRVPKFENQQYGSGTEPVLPDYILVGPTSGYVGTLNLDDERAKYNTDPTKGSYYLVMPSNKSGTNWWDELTRTAITNRHSLGFSGGNDKSSFYISLAMQDQQGVLIHQDFKRYNMRLNSEHQIIDKLRIGQNLQMTYIKRRGIIGGNGGRGAANEESQYLSAFRMPSIIPVYDAFGGYAGTAAKGFNNPRNPVAERDRASQNGGYGIGLFGNFYAELDIAKGLTARSSFGGAMSNSYYNFYNKPSYENSENGNDFLTYGEGASSYHNWTFTNTLKYAKKFDIHGLDLLLGYEALNTGKGRNIDGSGQRPFSNDPNYITLTTTSNRVVTSNYALGNTFASVFGQVRYSLMDKYYVNAIVRRDGASRFGANNRYGVFPAFSAGWRITDEAFLQGNSILTDVKIRGGWGQMGNSNNVDPLNNFSTFQSNLGQSFYDITGSNGAPAEGFFRNRIGNPDAKWETSTSTNIGVDATLVEGKFEVVFDIWRKDTKDLLYSLETPAVVGPVASDPSVNIAEMRNQGIDLMVINRGNINPTLTYEVTLTGSFLNNEILSLAPDVDYFESGGTRIGNAIRNQVGGPIASYFGYRVTGLFQNQAEVDAAPAQDGKGVGRFRYEDVNGRGTDGKLTGTPDGKIDADDRTYLGDPIPDFSGGINLNLGYKNFEVTAFLYTALGFQNYNFSRWFTDFYPSFTGAAYGNRVKESFTFENGGSTTPIFENVSNTSTNNGHNSYYVEKGNYARLTNLQIAYKFPSAVLSKIGLDRARVYVQATNLFTITKYSGLDPGVGGAADTTLGLDFGNPPVTRGFNVGLNLGF